MKYSIFVKAIAIFLAALTLTGTVVSVAGIALLGWANLYSSSSYEQWQENEMEERSRQLAQDMLLRWCLKEYSNVPYEVCMDFLYLYAERDYDRWIGLVPDTYGYTITDSTGKQVHTDGEYKEASYEYQLTSRYPVTVAETDSWEEEWYFNSTPHYIAYKISPVYTVTVSMQPQSLGDYEGLPMIYIHTLFALRYWLIAVLGGCLAIFAACMVYLCCAAGRKPGREEISPGGLNRIPLDIYLAAVAGSGIGFIGLTIFILDVWVLREQLNVGGLALAAFCLLLVATLIIGFFFALAAQTKVGKAWWLRHTLIGTICILLFKGLRFVFRAIGKLFSLLPMIWQYLLAVLAMGFVLLFAIVICVNSRTGLSVLFLLHTIGCCLALIAYGGYALGTIFKGIKRMRQGDLEQKINTRFLFGSYRKAAEDLNSLAEAAKLSAEKQLKSERMKTELITNVSHDLKTPLTSIINYVDLLQKPHTPEEGEQYLEVLSRQSRQMKKLVDDLMEVSKAATGNVAVELRQLDAVEAVNQALGEYADRLSAADLTVVCYPPEQAMICADGKLTWRVLSNLLHNAVKYALPGTRVYVDIQKTQEQVQISLKNISREPLNMTAEELMERFVRGDTARNTEGSGLGLNIAQSLMELQHGKLELTVDGDLFKVTLTFPAANIWVVG